MSSRRTSNPPERTRATHPGLILMAAIAVLTATFFPTIQRRHNEAAATAAVSSQPCLDACSGAVTDIAGLDQPTERE